MGKKKHDSEAFDNGVKKEKRLSRVPLPVDMGRVLHANWVTCNHLGDVHVPGGGWRLSCRQVPVPPMPVTS
jgi:hypothetical protein